MSKNDITGDSIRSGKGDQQKIAENWPWPDPFEQRLAMKREEEKREQSRNSPVIPPIGR